MTAVEDVSDPAELVVSSEIGLDLDFGGLDLGELDALTGLHLRLAQTAVQRLLVEILEPLEVTQKQVAVLWLVSANPGVSQIQLATTLAMDRATMMAIVDRLDSRGLIVRQRSKVDRRRQELALTPEGEALLTAAKTLVAEHERRIEEAVGAKELAAFMAALRRLHG
jgi:DNA-binding MarR family transcriptional regulator